MFDWNNTKPKLAMLGNMVDMLHRLIRNTEKELDLLLLRVDELNRQVSKIAERLSAKSEPDFVKLETKKKQSTAVSRKTTTKNGEKSNGLQR